MKSRVTRPRLLAYLAACAVGITTAFLISSGGTLGYINSLNTQPKETADPVIEDYPFSVTTLTVARDAGDTELLRFVRRYSRSSSGMLVEERAPDKGAALGNRTLYLRGPFRKIVVDTVTESVTTYFPSAVNAAIRQEAQCTHSGQLRQVAGVDTYRVDEWWEAPGQDRVLHRERWIAPALGCFALRSVSTWYNSGEVVSTTLVEPIAIAFEEPGAQLFEVPRSFTERAPSEVILGRMRVDPEEYPCLTCAANPDALERLDAIYSIRAGGTVGEGVND